MSTDEAIINSTFNNARYFLIFISIQIIYTRLFTFFIDATLKCVERHLLMVIGMRKILTVALVLAFILGTISGYLFPLISRPSKSSNNMNVDTGIMVPALVINVYDKKGKLMKSYVKVGDLPTKNFLKWIMHSLWYSTTVQQVFNGTWTAEDGTTGDPSTAVHGAYYTTVAGKSTIALKIALGNGTTTPTIDDYALANKLVEIPVLWYAFDANSTHMWIEVKATYTATSPINITEVGLFGYMQKAISTNQYWIMLFRDVFSQITLDTDQSIEIRYYVYVRYG